ncbi:uncharacterized protein CXorf65 homolog [Tyto alba]|uniref:uncharacterized protein CXorf65 homolog n=1 Tax=Tyto alba TaxID=56313 RepID=UPI001C66430C|nr:uncharacterized protein CXorf65 homolog [Tyto alba]
MFIYIKHGDGQSFLANTSCAVLPLLSYVRRMVGVPEDDVVDLCDELGTPKLLFQVTSPSKMVSEFLQERGTHYVCRVELGAPGTEEEHERWSFTPLLEHPSAALTGALQLQDKHPRRRQAGALKMPEASRTPGMETLLSAAQGQGEGKALGQGTGTERTKGTRRKATSPSRAGPGPGQRDPQ